MTLLDPWTGAYELPPFGEFTDADFEPAIMEALERAKADIAGIAESSEEPTFSNTIEALESAGKDLGRVLSTFYTLASTDANPEREALQRKLSPILSAHFSDIVLNEGLWTRIEDVWGQRDDLELTAEGGRLLELTHRNFTRAGAGLDAQGKSRLKEINGRLAEIGTAFTQNLLADERGWSRALSEDDMSGLPDWLIAGCRSAGEERGADGPVLTLSRSIVVPFLQFSPLRELRKEAYQAWTARGMTGGETDNRAITVETLQLRHERASLLGFEDFSGYKLKTEMAKTPEAVRDFLMAVWAPARAKAEADTAQFTAMLEADGHVGPLEPWDWHFYAEKRRQAEHDLDEAAIKPYFQLDRMIDAAFDCSNRLFGLEFKEVDVPLHHPDARAWEVTRDGRFMALFIGDYFARGGKRSGAWCSAPRSQQAFEAEIRPVVLNVCNFVKPPEGEPALLSYDDARTLFHEFGHALHQMLSDVTYESLSGTSVPRDFVELPSQLYEHWLDLPEVLSKHAVHAETGEPIPQDMLKRLLDATLHNIGFETVEYLASAIVDLEFHAGPPPADTMQRQAEILEDIGMPHAIGMRHATPHFAHVFAGGGYASGYYSYMWSEAMDADAFEAFEEAGDPFDPERAKSLEDNILSRGGTEEPDLLYKGFRGRLPGVEALLKGRGFEAAA